MLQLNEKRPRGANQGGVMRAFTKRETEQLWTAGAALIGIAVGCFLLTGCDIPGYKPHNQVAQGTDSSSGRSADTQASFASSGVRTGGTTPATVSTVTPTVTS